MNKRENRRTFVKKGAALGAIAASASQVMLHAQEGKPSGHLKIGFIGCGGRGTGAAAQALQADPGSKLVAMADVSQEQMDKSYAILKNQFPEKVDVPIEKQFIGLDGFQKVIDADVDVVLLATPPGFRPMHFEAAVEAGKHIFIEKPMAVDMEGVHRMMKAVKRSKEKKLSVVAGFCWRYDESRRAFYEKVKSGFIGDIRSIFATYYTGLIKPMLAPEARTAEMADVEWQVLNWNNFCWLSGDSLVEQACHSIDKISWAMGDVPPLAAVATGGRQVPMEGTNIYDHFHVAYEYENGVKCHLGSRQQAGCHNENADYLMGSKGFGELKGPKITLEQAQEGGEKWRHRVRREDKRNMYQVEHNELFASIREGKPINDGDRMMISTAMAILGREAAYTGKRVTWEDLMKSNADLAPDSLKLEDAFDVGEIPKPGVQV